MVGQDVFQIGNLDIEFFQLVDDLLSGESGQPSKLHVQNRLALDVIDAKLRIHFLHRLIIILGALDDLNDAVDVV